MGRHPLVAGIIVLGALAACTDAPSDPPTATPAPDHVEAPSTAGTSSPVEETAPAPVPSETPVDWPTGLTEHEAMFAGSPTWAVWLVAGSEADATAASATLVPQLSALGYAEVGTARLVCHDGSTDEPWYTFGDTDPWGVPVFFASAEDAQAFVDRWDGPYVGTDEGSNACDYD